MGKNGTYMIFVYLHQTVGEQNQGMILTWKRVRTCYTFDLDIASSKAILLSCQNQRIDIIVATPREPLGTLKRNISHLIGVGSMKVGVS